MSRLSEKYVPTTRIVREDYVRFQRAEFYTEEARK